MNALRFISCSSTGDLTLPNILMTRGKSQLLSQEPDPFCFVNCRSRLTIWRMEWPPGLRTWNSNQSFTQAKPDSVFHGEEANLTYICTFFTCPQFPPSQCHNLNWSRLVLDLAKAMFVHLEDRHPPAVVLALSHSQLWCLTVSNCKYQLLSAITVWKVLSVPAAVPWAIGTQNHFVSLTLISLHYKIQ